MPTTTVRSRRGALGLALALVAVSACGDDDSETNPRETADPGGATTVAATSASVAEIDRDATLRFASDFDATSLDPLQSNSTFDNVALFPIYDRLVHVDPETAEPVPGLAASWSFGDDGRTLELQLREGVTFHDGTPFNADAVKDNIDRLKSTPESQAAAEAQALDSAEVIDDSTVLLHLSEPAAYLPTVLSGRPGMMVSPAAFDDPDLGTKGAGAGMYQNVQYRPGDLLVYERNENYWDPDAVGAAQLELHVFADSSAMLNAVRTGRADIAPIVPQQVEEAESSGLDVVTGESLSVWVIPLNRSHPALAETEVRQALSHALDREGIAAAIFAGEATPAGQPFPEGSPFHAPVIGDSPYPHDVEAARGLLEQAGYADGFEMTLGVIADSLLQEIGEAVQAQFAAIGVTVNLKSVDGAQYRVMWQGGQFDGNVSNPGSFSLDPWQAFDPLVSEDGAYNPASVPTSDALEGLLDAAARTSDPDERVAAVQQLVEAVIDEALYLPIAHQPEILAADEGVVGARIWFSNQMEFRGVGIAG